MDKMILFKVAQCARQEEGEMDELRKPEERMERDEQRCVALTFARISSLGAPSRRMSYMRRHGTPWRHAKGWTGNHRRSLLVCKTLCMALCQLCRAKRPSFRQKSWMLTLSRRNLLRRGGLRSLRSFATPLQSSPRSISSGFSTSSF